MEGEEKSATTLPQRQAGRLYCGIQVFSPMTKVIEFVTMFLNKECVLLLK